MRIGQYRLIDDEDCKATCDGYEISPRAVERLGIKPETIHTANGKPVSAEWAMHGSIMVEHRYV